MRNVILFVFLLAAGLSASAQNEVDAYLATSLEYSGTARFVAMGSSMGALGGDASALSINPAGLGVYRHGEFTLSPSIVGSKSVAQYYGQSETGRDVNFTVGNIGYIQVQKQDKGPWKSFQFGYANTRLKDFHQDYRIQGQQAESSILDFYTSQLNQGDYPPEDLESFDPFYSYSAYQAYLINPYEDALGTYYIDTIGDGVNLEQTADLRFRGRIGESVISFAGNKDDKLYIGGALAFQRIIRQEELTYQESVVDTAESSLLSHTLIQDLEVSGSGFNIKLGFIYRLTNALRLGGSYNSPTWYTMSNDWVTSSSSRFKSGEVYESGSSLPGRNEYALRTPSRLTGSLGLVIAKQGLINIDYEYVDYSGAKLNGRGLVDIDFKQENAEIAVQYESVSNVRVGGEFRYKTMSFRGGLGYYPSPYKEGGTISDAEKMIYSGGIGYRKDNLVLDAAYRVTQFSNDYYIYSPDLVNAALIDQTNTSVVITAGLRF